MIWTSETTLETIEIQISLNEIFAKVISGVKEIHHLGFVHRDLKPDNVVLNLDPLEVRVIDFDRS